MFPRPSVHSQETGNEHGTDGNGRERTGESKPYPWCKCPGWRRGDGMSAMQRNKGMAGEREAAEPVREHTG